MGYSRGLFRGNSRGWSRGHSKDIKWDIPGDNSGDIPGKFYYLHPLSSRHFSPNLYSQVLVQQGPWLGLQSLLGFRVHGFWSENSIVNNKMYKYKNHKEIARNFWHRCTANRIQIFCLEVWCSPMRTVFWSTHLRIL